MPGSRPSILTNMAFRQSRTWAAATTSICRGDETPDDLPPLRQALRLFKLRREFDAVVTDVTGSAYVTGMHTFVIDPDDPLRNGFSFL